jgi:gamma-glutamylcyclotransferase (GGCT)/AIG2-like uncharacterized protein YtfP
MSASDRSVFVYGTLKPGGRYWPEFCRGKVDDPVVAKIRGELYDLHVGYPGLRLKGENWVQGYILTFRSQQDFLRLDDLEGYSPDRPHLENEYIRLRVAFFASDGNYIQEAWTYEVTESTMARYQGTLILNGEWPL